MSYRRRRKNSSCIMYVLILLLAITGIGILWLGVPILAANSFGASADNLSKFQKWSYSLQLLLHKNALVSAKSQIPQDIPFQIQSGESVSSIAINLEDQGVITNWSALRFYIIYKGLDTQIKAGDYILSPSMNAIEIAQLIQSSYSTSVPFYIYPGWRAEEIANALPTSGIEVTPADFLSVVRNPSVLSLPDYMSGIATLEGFLFPGEYIIERQISAQDLAMIFVNQFDQKVGIDLRQKLENNGLSFYKAIVMASIIQRETFDDNERDLMASVFYNRLDAGMKLETDPTVQYALGFSTEWGGWWKSPLLVSDLQFQSPFNTYVIQGLPEQPISNPDLPSIYAVAEPKNTNYFYFRARCDGSGSHVFSKTLEEHESNACQ